jgi:actin related protein 2/3 complex subunit 2
MGSKKDVPGMRLETTNMIIEESLGERLVGGQRAACELSVADFDGSRWKLKVDPAALSVVTVHLDIGCWKELEAIGARGVLDSVYAGMATQADPGYKVAVSVDCDACADKAGTLEKLIKLKRNLLGHPFAEAFAALAAGTASAGPVAVVPWRDSGEAVYVMAQNDPAQPQHYDRVCVVYAVDFPEETDRAMCRVMLQQFAEQHRKIGNAPPVVFSEAKAPPLEIRDLVQPRSDLVGFVSFTIFARHVDTDARLAKKVDLCLAFRHYLHYHIKCAKTNLHMRMRRKVRAWLQILNKAIMPSNIEREKKTVSGRTFTRK